MCITVKFFEANICKGWMFESERLNGNAAESRRDWPCTYGVCNRALGYFHNLNAFLHISLMYEYIHRTNVTNLFLCLLCFLCLSILLRFFIGANVVWNFAVCVSAKYSYKSWQIKEYGFPLFSVASFSCKIWARCEPVIQFQLDILKENPLHFVTIMPTQCRWSDIWWFDYLLFLRIQSFSIPRTSTLNPREFCGQTVRCLIQQEVESMLLACNGFSKVFSTVVNCGFTQAQCAVVNRDFMEYLAQQWRVIKVNSYFTLSVPN